MDSFRRFSHSGTASTVTVVGSAQGALLVSCMSIDAMLSCANKDDLGEANRLTMNALCFSYTNVMNVLREPRHSSGASRDPVTKARTFQGFASDVIGHFGICTCITSAVIDEPLDGRSAFPFRTVMIRATIAVVQMSRAMNVNGMDDVVTQLLRRCDDCDTALLRRMGMIQRLNERIAQCVAIKMAVDEARTGVEGLLVK